jgi:hypothetical protein
LTIEKLRSGIDELEWKERFIDWEVGKKCIEKSKISDKKFELRRWLLFKTSQRVFGEPH